MDGIVVRRCAHVPSRDDTESAALPESMVMASMMRRWAWLGVLAVGLILYVLVLIVLVATQNPNFVPSMILLERW